MVAIIFFPSGRPHLANHPPPPPPPPPPIRICPLLPDFSIRDNQIFESQMSKFNDGDYTGGAGPSQMEAGEKKLK